MKNILIINQPLGNRGDESAHRALVRTLNKNFPQTKIIILTLFDWNNAEEEFIVDHPNNQYINFLFSHNLGASFIAKWSIQYGGIKLALILHPILRRLVSYYRNADLILCAPGGICMGGFQDWSHLFALYIAKIYNKPLAYYSRSFGPFPTKTRLNRRFKRIAEEILHYFSFISIRDNKTMEIAQEMNIAYTPSIDTAFLERPIQCILKELKYIDHNKFIVFVPNSLTWHYAYKEIDQTMIDSFYLSIIEQIHALYPAHKIIMLPQLCSLGNLGDYNYFNQLKQKSRLSDSIVVISDKYGSDIQQSIISKADLVIGARYHSIVFAINNNRPFIALNYEHKIAGLLSMLNLSHHQINITDIFADTNKYEVAIEKCIALLKNPEIPNKDIQANKIAHTCFSNFTDYIKKM